MCSTRDEMRQEETNLGWDPSLAFLLKEEKKVAKKGKKNKKAAAWNPRPVFFFFFLRKHFECPLIKKDKICGKKKTLIG
jgi:hypothetical protein